MHFRFGYQKTNNSYVYYKKAEDTYVSFDSKSDKWNDTGLLGRYIAFYYSFGYEWRRIQVAITGEEFRAVGVNVRYFLIKPVFESGDM